MIILEIGFNEEHVVFWNGLDAKVWMIVLDNVHPPGEVIVPLIAKCEKNGNGFTFMEFDPKGDPALKALSSLAIPRRMNDEGHVESYGKDVLLEHHD